VLFRQKLCGWHAADGAQYLRQTGGLLVWNWEVHCHTKGCVSDKNDEVFRPVIEDADGALQNWTVTWRETEPRHFLNPGAFYETGYNRSCGAVVANNYRNEVAAAWLRDHAPWVFIIRISAAMESAWQMHFGEPDCTHCCYTPWRFRLAWDGMLQGLRQSSR